MTEDLRVRLRWFAVTAMSILMGSHPLFAAGDGGTVMPWDTGLAALKSNLSGPVAKSAVGIAIVIAGITWMFGNQHSEGGQKVAKVIFGGGIAAFSLQTLSALGLDGAVV